MSGGISIFNKGDRDKINDEARKAREERSKFDNRPILDPSIPHRLVVTAMETTSWKPREGGEVFSIQFTLEPLDKSQREKTKPIIQRWNVHRSDDCSFDIEMSIKMFIDFLSISYQANGIPESSGMEDLLNKLKKYIEVPFWAAIRHRQRLWKKELENGTIEPIITTEAILYYTSSIDDTTFKATKAEKRIIPMKPEEKEEYERLKNLAAGVQPVTASDLDFSLPPEESVDDDPFK